MNSGKPVIIIGGGIGGLSTAIHLAREKHPVILFEKNPRVGGKMAEIRQDGFRWDIGPSVITMRDVLEDLFSSLGKRLDDFLQLLPVDPLTRYFFANGKKLDIWRDLSRTSHSIAEIHPKEVEGYFSYLAYAARQFRLTSPIYIYGPPPTLRSLRQIGLRDLLQVDIYRDLQAAISEHVDSPEMRQFFGRFATYVGANPYKAPALLSVIAYVELVGGVWYPRGGIQMIAEALERLAIEMGVKIVVNKAVKQILVQDRAVFGVVLDDGTLVEADYVVSNVDVATTYATLLPDKPPYRWELENIQKASSSFSAFILLLGVKGRFPELAHHNIFFSQDYRKEFGQIAKGLPPADPTIYLAITSKTDFQHAPSGHENWFVMVNVPPIDPSFNWEQQADGYQEVVLNRLKSFGFDLADKIVTRKIITPLDLQEMSGANRGALYGMSLTDWTAPLRRPQPLPKTPAGLFFVGGTTHPGGGVPMVILSGKQVARLVVSEIQK